MSPAPEITRRTELAEVVADVFISTGNVRLSLRALADVIDTSARMLVHHFGSRESLVAAALEVARARQLNAARRAFSKGTDTREFFEELWRWYKSAETRRFFNLFNDVAALERSTKDATPQFGARLGSEWLPMFETVFSRDPKLAPQSKELSRLLVATIRGFALDQNSGTKPKDQEPAYQTLTKMILKVAP